MHKPKVNRHEHRLTLVAQDHAHFQRAMIHTPGSHTNWTEGSNLKARMILEYKNLLKVARSSWKIQIATFEFSNFVKKSNIFSFNQCKYDCDCYIAIIVTKQIQTAQHAKYKIRSKNFKLLANWFLWQTRTAREITDSPEPEMLHRSKQKNLTRFAR